MNIAKQKRFYVMMIPAVLHGAIKDNINLWVASYYIDKFHIDLAAISIFIFLIPLLGLIGRLFFPFLYRLCKSNEIIVTIVAFSILGVFIVPLCLKGVSAPTATISLCVISAMISVINTSILSAFPLRFARAGSVSFVSGAMDFLTYGGAALSSVLYGLLIERFGYTQMFVSWGAFSVLIVILLAKSKLRSDE